MKNFVIQKGPITFCVDYYVELLGVLFILCDDQEAIQEAGCVRCNEQYVEEVRKYFKNTGYEKLTSTLALFSDKYYFNYDAPVALMLMLSGGYPIDKEALFKEREVIPDCLFDAFIRDLLIFEKASNFNAFYTQHFPMYETIIRHFIEDYDNYNSHDYLLSYLKIQPDCQFCINFMLGITNGNFGVSVGNQIYANIMPYRKSRYAPLPDYSYEPIYYSTLILHEFAHSFINPLTASYADRINKIDIAKYAQQLDEFCYGDSLETLINETIIRALECMYVREYFEKWYEPYIQEYEEEGYLKIRDTIDCLDSGTDFDSLIALFM